MRTLRTFAWMRVITGFLTLSMLWLQIGPAFATSNRLNREHQDFETRLAQSRAQHLLESTPKGTTQTPDVKLQEKIAARQAAAIKPMPNVRVLSANEMKSLSGRGALRNSYFSGTLPWQKSFRDVNVCTGNLFKSFTDIQVSPGRGAGLVMQRTYNSNDARVGPFGIGWTSAYDIRMQEAADVATQTGNTGTTTAVNGDAPRINDVPRTDFFGAKHTYHRDADGLYSPPSYCYDETSSDYDTTLATGPTKVMSDTEKGLDGTIKHFTNMVTLADGSEGNERYCDYIEDRHGNRTVLSYNQTITQPDGSTRKLLTAVTDPVGRSLSFAWTNLGTTSQPAWRITEIDGPIFQGAMVSGVSYRVVYDYFTNTSDPASYQNLKSVTLDPDGLNRKTSYTYTSVSGNSLSGTTGTEYGLLASITNPLGQTEAGHVVTFGYSTSTIDWYSQPTPNPTRTVWVTQITEPAGVGTNGLQRTLTWTLLPATYVGYYGGYAHDTIITSSAGGYLFVQTNNLLQVYQVYTRGAANSSYYQYDNANHVIYHSHTGHTVLSTPYPRREFVGADTYTYTAHGDIETHQTLNGTGQESYTYYDASKYFQKASVTDANGHTSTFDYYDSQDASIGNRGEAKWVRDAGYFDTTSPSYQKQASCTYNSYGQKLNETNLNQVTTNYSYGTNGNAWGYLTQVVQDLGTSSHLNRTTSMSYDIMGHVLQSIDPVGRISSFQYNTLGQPLVANTPVTANKAAETISYSYGVNGRTQSVTDNRGTTSMAYEAGGDRVSSVTDPITGTLYYTYNIFGSRTSMSLPGGGTWTYTYTDVTHPLEAGPYPWDHVPSQQEQFSSNGISAPGLWVLTNEDDLSSLTLLLDHITDDQGRVVNYEFNSKGGIVYATSDQSFNSQGAGTTSLKTEYILDPTTPHNAQVTTHGWLSETNTIWNEGGTDVHGNPKSHYVNQNDYTYDLAGNRLTNTISKQVQNADGTWAFGNNSDLDHFENFNYTNATFTRRVETYQYDATNRLTNVDYGDGETQSYSFDAQGNRLGKSDTVSGSTTNTTYGYDAADRLTTLNGTVGAYTNDANGNTLTGAGRTNVWDSTNRLVSCTVGGVTTTYTYGADGFRRSSTKSGVTTYYVYDGQTLVREMKRDANNVLQSTATYFIGARGAEYRRNDSTGDVKWYVYDGLGSVVAEVDPSGNITAAQTYDVYGAKRGTTGTSTTNQGFVGQLGHPIDETGLIYMRARYYDPNLGRFASQDPGGNGSNWFVYANDAPTTGYDITGKDVSIVFSGVGALISGVFGLIGGNFVWDLIKPAIGKLAIVPLGNLLASIGQSLIKRGEAQLELAGELEAAGIEASLVEGGLGPCLQTMAGTECAHGIESIVLGSTLKLLGEYLANTAGTWSG